MTDVPIDNIVPFNDGQVRWADGFINLLAGLGVQGRDKFASQQYTHQQLNLVELENAYRSDWIARKVVTIPAWDMTREWRDWQADPDQIELLETVEKKLFVQMKLQQALIKARLYGGAAIIIGVDAGSPEEELDLELVGQDSLKFIHVVSKQQLRAGPIIRDISSKYFGQPEFYEAANEPAPKTFQQEPEPGVKPSPEFTKLQVKLHPSRVIKLIGMDTADQMLNDIWGDSVLQAVNDAVKMCGLVTGSLATLVAELKVDVIKIPELKSILSTAAGERKMLARFSAANAAKSVINTIMIDGNEEWQRIQANLTNVPETMMAYMQIAAGAADIPATRFLGMSPAGLNATGESDIRNYYDRLAAEQTTVLTPTMTHLDEVIIRSALGDRPPEVWYEWGSLWQHSDAEKADIALKKAQTYQIDVNAAQLPVTALANGRANQLIEDGFYPGLEKALDEAALEGDTIEEANKPPPMDPAMEAMAAAAENGEIAPPVPPNKPGGFPPKGGGGGNPFGAKKKPVLAVVGGDGAVYDRDYVRVPAGQKGGGQFGSHGGGDIEAIRPSDSDPAKPWPKEDDGKAGAGDDILVFRLQSANGDLPGSNGGNVNAVANHLTNIDDFEKPAFVGGSGDTIASYQVKLTADPGKYDAMIEGGKAAYGRAAENPDSVGRSTKRGANDYVENAYSFPKSSAGFEHRKLDSVPLSAVRGKLKEMGYHSADDAGTLKTSQAIRTVFNERAKRVGDEQVRHPKGSSMGGKFAGGMGAGGEPRLSKAMFEKLMAETKGQGEKRAAEVAKIVGAGEAVRMTSKNRPGHSALVGPDVSEPGKYRITRFDPQGPIGHTVHNTLGEAAENALREGYKVSKRDAAPLVRALADYNLTHVPAGSSEGGQFGTSKGGGSGGGKSAKGGAGGGRGKKSKSPREREEERKAKAAEKAKEPKAKPKTKEEKEKAKEEREKEREARVAERQKAWEGKQAEKGAKEAAKQAKKEAKQKEKEGKKKEKEEGKGGKEEAGKKGPSFKSSYTAPKKEGGGGGGGGEKSKGEKSTISTGGGAGAAGGLANKAKSKETTGKEKATSKEEQTPTKSKGGKEKPVDPKLAAEQEKEREEVRKARARVRRRDSYPELYVSRETFDYDPNQPRGPDGKWGEGGAGGKTAKAEGIPGTEKNTADLLKPSNETVDQIIDKVPGGREFVDGAKAKLEDSVDSRAPVSEGGFKDENGNWIPSRQAEHEKIIADTFTPEAIAAATPAPGEQPTLDILGGRGGSGKSFFTGPDGTVNEDKAIVLNNDNVKAALSNYEGWNAANVHEESSEVGRTMERMAKDMGLNVVIDGTMKSENGAHERIDEFKEAGYKVNGHYMYTSPEKSAERALKRAVDGEKRFNEGKQKVGGRFVDPSYSHGSRTNEKTFDAVKHKLDNWQVYDNNVDGRKPQFHSRKGG